MNQEFVFSFAKNDKEAIRFSLREYKGQLYFDARLFFKSEAGEWRPTRKGLTLSAGFFGDFENGVRRLSELLSLKGGVA